jgi:DNA-binding CsgD family transcriptional regulator
MELIGRRAERDVLDRLLADIRTGDSRALVVHGEPGVGKTALLDYLAGQASGCRLTRAAGVESEMEFAYAGLQQLCAPMLDRLEHLPAPQHDALATAFGISAGPAPDRFLIGLAVLGMFSDIAEEQPLVCLVDDVQWLDRASAQVVTFVARRLRAESVGLVLATHVPNAEIAELPELQVSGLRDADARALLDAVLTAPLDARVRDRLVAETRGNPLALLELPHLLPPEELAGGFGLPAAARLSATEENFRRRVEAFPEATRRLLLLAAAEPLGDLALLWRAAARLGMGAEAAAPAVEAGLAEFGTRVRFRHPLVRAAAYRSAPLRDRQLVHGALAEVTDGQLDPDRRAWHRARAAAGPDDDVAAELERSAGRARARGGLAAAAAFLESATMLTLNPAQRAERALAAASAKVEAGAFDAALDLLAVAEGGPLSDFQHARVDLVRAQLGFVTGRGRDAPPLLLRAAKRLEPIDADLSRATYLETLSAQIFAGRLAVGGGVLEVARAVEASPRPAFPRAPDFLLDGLAAHFTNGYAAGLPILRQALSAARPGVCPDEDVHWLWLAAGIASVHVWDDESWDVLSERYVQLARAAGALSELPVALSSRAMMLLFAGELTAAASLIEEVQTATEATGGSLAPYGALGLAAFRGDQAALSALIETTTRDVTLRGEGIGMTAADWASAVLNNGIGRYQTALSAAQRATDHPADLGVSAWAAVELIEAAVRCGMTDIAAGTLRWLTEITSASATDWALGVEARSRALLNEGEDAERLYRESIERLGRTRVRAELARAHLLYGEWLRRERRRTDARAQLRTAHQMLEEMGMAGFGERARRELQATGATARKRAVASDQGLTAQEALIARLARDGLSNPEIGARLFISARTVQYHLRKVFGKLGISSRSQLDRVLPGKPSGPAPR